MEKRYRVEHTLYESDRNPVDVMVFETFELGNTDILIHLKNTYLQHNSEMKEMALKMIDSLESSENTTISHEEYVIFFKDAIREIEQQTGEKVQYVLWLASEDAVRNQYAVWYDGVEMDEYETSNIILSDLGYDGALYGYTYNPQPIRSITLS